ERATVHRLDDEWGPERPEGHWPAAGRLKLDGFTYGGFGGEKRASLQQRLAWIRKGHATTKNDAHAYRAQPYQQLAHVYRLFAVSRALAARSSLTLDVVECRSTVRDGGGCVGCGIRRLSGLRP